MFLEEEDYDAEKAAWVLKQTRAGFLPHEYCGQDLRLFPTEPGTVDIWANTNQAFAKDLAEARLIGADALVARCVYIADNTTDKADAKKIKIEARMKAAALWNPTKYGPQADKQAPPTVNLHAPLPATPEAYRDMLKNFGLADV